MKKTFLLLSLTIVLSLACSSTIPATPTLVPTPTFTQTETSTPEPTRTHTPEPTFTPTSVPTLEFYSVSPTLAATAASCRVLPRTMCFSGILVHLTGQKLDEYEVTMSYPGLSGASFKCPAEGILVTFGENMAPVMCDSDRIFFIGVGLTELTLTLTWDGGSTTETLSPVFHVDTPEGPDCNPQCLVGEAEMNIP